MKKWLIGTAVALLFVAGIIAGAYMNALGPKKDAAQDAFRAAKEASGLVTMDDFFIYNGKDSYNVVVGKTAGGEKQAVWLPNDANKKPFTANYDAGKSKNEILKIAGKNPKEIISIKLGMENNTPLWEITYLDSSNRYNYDYYDFKTGEWLKYYRSI
ncbi:peptidase [Peribacillus glennii]|uniref:Peptidase n=1 Tax=Peribacillus glennii TaxID=2303991 RepID=A0A372LGU2_9BACI|nr:peptidase [Peribacillus glennii]